MKWKEKKEDNKINCELKDKDKILDPSIGNDNVSNWLSQLELSPFGNCYTFELKEVIDNCPEYLIPWQTLVKLANEVGLELVSKQNFKEFFNVHCKEKKYHDLLYKMRVIDNKNSLTADEWEVCSIYTTFTFKKSLITNVSKKEQKTEDKEYKSNRMPSTSKKVNIEDIICLNN